jgi:hypothetical protein
MTASRRDPHLGELAAALVDCALDHDARDRALSHLTRCEECRGEVDAQRRLKAQLSSLGGPVFPPGLADRLRTLPDRTPAPSTAGLPPDRFGARFRTPARPDSRAVDDRPLTATGDPARDDLPPRLTAFRLTVGDRPGADRPGAERPAAVRPGAGRAIADRPGGRGPGGRARARRRRIAATAAGGLAAFALTFATVVAAGGQDEPEPVAPQIGTFMEQHTQETGGVPGTEPEVGAVDAANTGR